MQKQRVGDDCRWVAASAASSVAQTPWTQVSREQVILLCWAGEWSWASCVWQRSPVHWAGHTHLWPSAESLTHVPLLWHASWLVHVTASFSDVNDDSAMYKKQQLPSCDFGGEWHKWIRRFLHRLAHILFTSDTEAKGQLQYSGS